MITIKDMEKALQLTHNFMANKEPLCAAEHASITLKMAIDAAKTHQELNHPNNHQLTNAVTAFNALRAHITLSVGDVQLLLTLMSVRQAQDSKEPNFFIEAALYHSSNMLDAPTISAT